MSAPAELREVIRRHVEKRAPLERAAREASWGLAVSGDARWEEESQRLETELKRLLSDRETFARIGDLIDRDGIREPEERRMLEVLRLDHLRSQADPAILERMVALEVKAEGIFANFRPRLDGQPVSENELRRLLRKSDDVQARRRAWEASKELGAAMAPLVLELVELRNRAARDLGFRDHYALALAVQEIDESYLFDTLENLERLTEKVHRELLDDVYGRLAVRFGIRPADIRPWHLADPFFQEAVPSDDVQAGRFYRDRDLVELSRRALAAMGFDVGAVLERSDLYPREGKNQHAFCTHVDRSGDDVRVLCNVAPDEYWMDTMLHELGHAVYDIGLAPDLPWLLREAAHTLSTEAIALLFGRLALNPDWMIRLAGAPADEVDALRSGLAREQRSKQLLFPRWVMVMAHFERALYADPAADLGKVWWDLVERFQKVPRPEGRSAPDWACKVHVALAPVYYHNYLLGDLMASQLDRFLTRELGTPFWFERTETAALLTDRLFRHGARRPWNEALVHATGEDLDPAAYVDQYVTSVA